MGDKSPSKREKKKKKEDTKFVAVPSIKPIMSQPELIKKPKKGI